MRGAICKVLSISMLFGVLFISTVNYSFAQEEGGFIKRLWRMFRQIRVS